MKIYTAVILGLLIAILTACGGQTDNTTPTTNVEISVIIEPDPPSMGESTLIVTLKDSDGNAINGATLKVHGDMDHAGMSPVDREVSASTNGEYRVPFEWTMGGGWVVTISAQLPNNGGKVEKTVNYFVEAVSSGSIINQHGRATEEATPSN